MVVFLVLRAAAAACPVELSGATRAEVDGHHLVLGSARLSVVGAAHRREVRALLDACGLGSADDALEAWRAQHRAVGGLTAATFAAFLVTGGLSPFLFADTQVDASTVHDDAEP